MRFEPQLVFGVPDIICINFFNSLSLGLMETTLTVGRLSTEQFNAPQITLSTSAKSCSHSRGWKVSPDIKIQHNI